MSILASSIAALLVSQSAHADDRAWSASPVNGNFTGANWTAGQAPGSASTMITDGDSLFFGTSTTTTLTDDEDEYFYLTGFNFNANAPAFTINGANSKYFAGNITNNSTSLQTINVPLAIDAVSPFIRLVTMTAGGGDVTLGGVLSIDGFTTAGTGTLTLAGANTHNGATKVSAGTTLKLANQLALQESMLELTGSLVFDQSVVSNAFTLGGISNNSVNIALVNNAVSPAPVALTVGQNLQSTTYSSVLSGTGSLIKIGTGTLTLSGTNTYTGTTTITGGGYMQISSDANLGTAPAVAVANQLTLDNATLLMNAQFTTASKRGVTLGSGGARLI